MRKEARLSGGGPDVSVCTILRPAHEAVKAAAPSLLGSVDEVSR